MSIRESGKPPCVVDAANQRVSLAWLALGDAKRARGYARLLIDDTGRWGLLEALGEALEGEERDAIAREIVEDKARVAAEQKRSAWQRRDSHRKGRGRG